MPGSLHGRLVQPVPLKAGKGRFDVSMTASQADSTERLKGAFYTCRAIFDGILSLRSHEEEEEAFWHVVSVFGAGPARPTQAKPGL